MGRYRVTASLVRSSLFRVAVSIRGSMTAVNHFGHRSTIESFLCQQPLPSHALPTEFCSARPLEPNGVQDQQAVKVETVVESDATTSNHTSSDARDPSSTNCLPNRGHRIVQEQNGQGTQAGITDGTLPCSDGTTSIAIAHAAQPAVVENIGPTRDAAAIAPAHRPAVVMVRDPRCPPHALTMM